MGTIVLIWAEVKKKKNDRKVKLLGAVITFVAMLSFLLNYYFIEDLISVVIGGVTAVYWAIVSVRLMTK